MSSSRFKFSRLFTDNSIPRIDVADEDKFQQLSYPKEGVQYISKEITDPFNSLVQYTVKLNGETDKEFGTSSFKVRSGMCKGCKVCPENGCELVFNLNSKKKLCPVHNSALIHQSCNTKFYFARNGNEQHVYSLGTHDNDEKEQFLPKYRKELAVTNNTVAKDLLWIRNLSTNLENTIIHTQFPEFSRIIKEKVSFLVIDLKHKSKEGPFYDHLGISSFIEEQKGGFALQLSRILMEEQTYKEPFLHFLNTLENDGCDLNDLFVGENRSIKGILVDFSKFQYNGLVHAFKVKFGEQGESIVKELTSGCFVHFLRSAKRLVNSLPIDQSYRELVFKMLESVQNMVTEQEILRIIGCIENLYAGAKSWCDWWRHPDIIRLLLRTSSQQHSLPRNTNNQEILNVNVPTFGGSWTVESEMLLREDILGLMRYLSLLCGVELSYRDTTKKGREARNKRRNELKFDSRPADTVARGIKQTPVSSIEVIQEFVNNVQLLDKKKLLEFAGEEADNSDDEDFVPEQPESRDSVKKSIASPISQKKRSKVIRNDSSSEEIIPSQREAGKSTSSVRKTRTPKKGTKRTLEKESDLRKKSKVTDSSSSGFDSSVSTTSSSSSECDSDESTNRDSVILTRSKLQIGNNDRSESSQLKAARKHGVQSSRLSL